MTLFEELKARGLIAQATHEDRIQELLDNGQVTFYTGFDPTADSLHIGHYLQLVTMARMQRAGHKPIALLGGGTTMVGDPTGKTDMRKMLTQADIQHNAACFKKQMSKLVEFGDGKAMMVDNGDWLLKFNYIEFLREVGVHFTVNRMLTAECFKSRMEKGLSFIEFNYMLMQSYDFLHLFREYGCNLQLGGDDQWSNIINGADLIRRVEGKEAFGMTFTLLTTSDGRKMGKTEKGAVWLDPEKTSPYEFYQYWRNVDDADVVRMMKFLTFMPLEEIAKYEHLEGSEINQAKEVLALEITTMVHGQEAAQAAQDAARALFVGGGNSGNVPTAEVAEQDFTDGSISILDLLVATKQCSSKGDARRNIEQGGVFVGDNKVENANVTFTKEQIAAGDFIIRKGKKSYCKVVIG